MPILDAKALDADPEGAALLRAVLDTGRRGRGRKLEEAFAPLGKTTLGLEARDEAAPATTVELEREEGPALPSAATITAMAR